MKKICKIKEKLRNIIHLEIRLFLDLLSYPKESKGFLKLFEALGLKTIPPSSIESERTSDVTGFYIMYKI